LSLQSILEIAPGHLPSLRALQRYFAEHDRRDDEVPILERMAENLAEGPDVTSHLRLAWRLRLSDPETPGDAADEMLLRIAPRAELDIWLAPRLLAAARAQNNTELARTAALRLAELLPGDEERAVARLRAAELSRAHDPQSALQLLRDAVASSPHHPTAAEELAETCELAGEWRDAAEAWERMARATEVRPRAAERFYRAGRIYQDHLGDLDRARAAFEEASERDVTHADLFDRLCEILQETGQTDRLTQVFEQRLTAGGETNEMVELYVKQARLYVKLNDLANAKSALRAALALQPERVDALRLLADLCLEDEDWRGAAEVLIRIARIRKEREELRWVFFTLGDIYDRHMPDPRRAEAAFQRVLKLLPQDVEAMDKLAVLYEREGQLDKAAEMLFELARLDVDPESNRAHRLKLAEIFERLGDARRAEQVLEEARKNAPTDLAALRALAEFYRRQNAGNALGMHLNRAVNDFRHALEADLGDAAAWPGLVELLSWRGDADAAGAAASAAVALGLVDVEISKLVDATGAAEGKGPAAAFDVIDDLLAPPELPAPTRMVFRLAGEALEKSLPFDVNAYRAERLGPRDMSVRPIAVECGRWFGIPEPQLFVTSAAPRVCVPVYSNPVTLLIGSELIAITDEREKLFVLVRALKIAQAQLAVVVRAQPHEVVALIGGLVHSYDPHHQPRGADPSHVAEAARRVAKHVNRKVRDELGPLVFEMAGRPGYDPARLAMAASEWGNRVALLASGSAPAAFSALAKLSGERELPADPMARITMLTRFPEANSLLKFAISDAHFEARRRAGRR
jgi:tetratricopeptide (TPR) repeat protein